MAERTEKLTPEASLEAENEKLRERVRQLELELGDAEKKSKVPDLKVFGTAALEEIVAARTKEVEEKSAALTKANAELRDLTDNLDRIVRKRTRALLASEEQLRKRNIELRRLNAMKAGFISIAAHELRTPMTSIIGYIELVLEERYGELSDPLRSRLNAVQRNSKRLMRLIEEMLNVSRIETGKVTLTRAPTDLVEIVSIVVDDLTPIASNKEHELEAHYSNNPIVDGDADKIHQVVANLISNAIRYTPAGGRIIVTVDDAPADKYPGAWARLRVRDNGIGIPKELHSRIFEPFADFHSPEHHTSSEPDSAGLGLYVARGLVDLHGGLITVDSREGEFTEFTVFLPLAADVTDSQPTV